MTEVDISRCVAELSEAYPGAAAAREGAVTLVRLRRVHLPSGCQPPATEAVVVLDPGQPKPRLLIKARPKTPAGVEPRNVNPETIGGEGWYGFSFNLVWDAARHTAAQFVEGMLRRFVKNE
jgi:hypothetical protein